VVVLTLLAVVLTVAGAVLIYGAFGAIHTALVY
jgi:hypothetical protein